mmetsp:Transcript_28063/g.97091  ORF Transcript_28063/g.97091 Transcript_28063/m.97091 type:complete len:356 (-) Transcript_28063:77-1144(-)
MSAATRADAPSGRARARCGRVEPELSDTLRGRREAMEPRSGGVRRGKGSVTAASTASLALLLAPSLPLLSLAATPAATASAARRFSAFATSSSTRLAVAGVGSDSLSSSSSFLPASAAAASSKVSHATRLKRCPAVRANGPETRRRRAPEMPMSVRSSSSRGRSARNGRMYSVAASPGGPPRPPRRSVSVPGFATSAASPNVGQNAPRATAVVSDPEAASAAIASAALAAASAAASAAATTAAASYRRSAHSSRRRTAHSADASRARCCATYASYASSRSAPSRRSLGRRLAANWLLDNSGVEYASPAPVAPPPPPSSSSSESANRRRLRSASPSRPLRSSSRSLRSLLRSRPRR